MIYKFICPLFQIGINLVTGDKKQLKRFECYEEAYHDAECHTIDIEKYDKNGEMNLKIRRILIWIEKSDDYNGMVHETIHLVKRVFEIMGVPFTAENDEIIAYYQNYWVRTFWHKMSKDIK